MNYHLRKTEPSFNLCVFLPLLFGLDGVEYCIVEERAQSQHPSEESISSNNKKMYKVFQQ